MKLVILHITLVIIERVINQREYELQEIIREGYVKIFTCFMLRLITVRVCYFHKCVTRDKIVPPCTKTEFHPLSN